MCVKSFEEIKIGNAETVEELKQLLNIVPGDCFIMAAGCGNCMTDEEINFYKDDEEGNRLMFTIALEKS